MTSAAVIDFATFRAAELACEKQSSAIQSSTGRVSAWIEDCGKIGDLATPAPVNCRLGSLGEDFAETPWARFLFPPSVGLFFGLSLTAAIC